MRIAATSDNEVGSTWRRRCFGIVAVSLLQSAAGSAQSAASADTARLVLPPLHLESLAFDAARNRLVLFGGSAELTGTLEWDGNLWRRAVDSASSPFPRAGAAMAYDPERRGIVLFGGQPRRAPNAPPRLCDTWTYDGRWTKYDDGPCVTERIINSSLVYDARQRAILLVDGTMIGRDTVLRSLRIWRLSETGWQLIDSAGPRRQGFSQVAFDDARGVLVVPVLFGGPDAGIWEWDGRRWRHDSASGPSTRQTYGLVYDTKQRRTMLIGGQATTRGPYLDDVWTWDGARWSELSREPGPTPRARGGGTLLRTAASDRLIYFGG